MTMRTRVWRTGGQVWVMTRGEIHAASDPFLSPFHPTVEDLFVDEDRRG
jgi:hypothetical protein